MKAAAIGAVALGFVLLASSALWSSVFSSSSSWSPEKSERLAHVKDRITNVGSVLARPPSMHRGADLGQLKAELEELKKENEQLNAEFQSAYDAPRIMTKVLKWGGISLAVICLIGWYAANQTQ
jgi:hypothetical protein